MSTLIHIVVTPEQAAKLRELVSGDNAALKNHIASAVEHDRQGHLSARELVRLLRKGEELFANVNGTIMRAEGKL